MHASAIFSRGIVPRRRGCSAASSLGNPPPADSRTAFVLWIASFWMPPAPAIATNIICLNSSNFNAGESTKMQYFHVKISRISYGDGNLSQQKIKHSSLGRITAQVQHKFWKKQYECYGLSLSSGAPRLLHSPITFPITPSSQSCSWIGLTHGLDWVGLPSLYRQILISPVYSPTLNSPVKN